MAHVFANVLQWLLIHLISLWWMMKKRRQALLALDSHLFCLRVKLNPKYELRLFGIPFASVDLGSRTTTFGFGDRLNVFPLCTKTNINVTQMKLNTARTAVMFTVYLFSRFALLRCGHEQLWNANDSSVLMHAEFKFRNIVEFFLSADLFSRILRLSSVYWNDAGLFTIINSDVTHEHCTLGSIVKWKSISHRKKGFR